MDYWLPLFLWKTSLKAQLKELKEGKAKEKKNEGQKKKKMKGEGKIVVLYEV